MNGKTVLVGAAILCIAALSYFFWPAPAVTNYPSAGRDIIALGDSLVTGIGGTSGGFVSIVAEDLSLSIINLGKPGDTSADVLARIGELDQYNPKVVMLLVGGNDYLKRVPPEETFTNIARIIENIQARGAAVLLLGVRGGLLQDNYEELFARLAERYHTAYVPNVLDAVIGNGAYMADQVHPNDAGYARIAKRVGEVLQNLLK